MWDVIWTDPDRELVGEHRAKKGRAQEDREKQGVRSGRNSSATSHSSSSSESPFGFFRSKGAKSIDTPKKSASDRPPSLSGLVSPSLLSSLSPFSQTFDDMSRRSSGTITTAPTSPNKDTTEAGRYSSETADLRPRHISFSNSSKSGEAVSPSLDAQRLQLLQSSLPIGDNISRAIDETTKLLNLLGESSDCRGLRDIAEGMAETKQVAGESNQALITTPSASPLRNKTSQMEEPESPVTLIPPPKSPLRPSATRLAFNDPNSWRRPEQWLSEQYHVYSLNETVHRRTEEALDVLSEVQAPDSSGKYNVAAMASTSPSAILARLSTLVDQGNGMPCDTNAEYESCQWMLSVLQHLDIRPLQSRHAASQPASESRQTMLVLQESKVIAKYFGALFPDTRVYHFFENPIDSDKYSNVQSLQVACSASEPFPTAPKLFQTAVSISLPSLYPYNDLPVLLDSVHRSLRENGVLKITIIDPLPCADTLGSRMRAWLEKNVLQNIEQQSRCVEPSRLFPKLLGDANLRGKGSRRTKVKFYALRESAIELNYRDPDPCIERLRVEKETKAVLRTVVGRMLWMQVWGKYVVSPTTWWWDDKDCLEECIQLGTFWEYHVIEAVKSN